MDTLIHNKDFAIDSTGSTISISGINEVIQSFILTLKIPLGSFCLDKSIGSDFVKNICQLSSFNLKSNILFLLKDIAANFELIDIENVEYSIDNLSSYLILDITISYDNHFNKIKIEVNV